MEPLDEALRSDRPAQTTAVSPLERVVFRHASPVADEQPLTTRERLIEAGWLEADELPLAKAFSGVTTASVAARAGVTTGSFFHHFRNGSVFADAMALAHALPDDVPERGLPPETMEESGEFIDLMELIRSALTQTWHDGTTSEIDRARFRYEMRLWSFHNSELTESTSSFQTVGQMIGHNYQIRQTQASGVWTGALARSGRELLHPFNLSTVATAVTALYEGLLLRAAVDPDAVSPTLFADASVALVSYFTGPAGMRASFDDSSVQLTGVEVRSPQARSGARRRRETWARVVASSTGLFGQGWESVTATDVADRAGISPQTVLNLFHTVRRVAAATFVTHANELYAFALENPTQDPMTGLRETLTALSLRTNADPEAARALLAERIEAGLHRGTSMADLDIRIEVPIGAAVGLWVNRLGIVGDHGQAVSSAIANFVLGTTLVGGLNVSEIVDMGMRLLPEDPG